MTYDRPIIVIAGPTASGKTDIAIKLAKKINGVIINADSKQIYKEISIGTARPSEKDFSNISHDLFGYTSVKENYNIYKYQIDVQKVLDKISKNQIPILTGGTGLYIDSVIFNYELHKGKNKKGKPLNHVYFVINIPKEELNKRIENRVEKMFQKGLLEENKMIREKELNNYKSMKMIGYQEFDDYFSGEKSLERVKEEIITHTKQYAKRQRTWFRRNKNAIWIGNYDQLLEVLPKFITM